MNETATRGRLPVATTTAPAVVPTGPRKKANRWGVPLEENRIANLLNLPTQVTGNLTQEQLEAYALNLRIEEITEKLKLGDVVPAKKERSPSPPPQYDTNGKRTNTPDVRYRQKLENERHTLVEKALRLIPNYKPPTDYKRPQRTQEKIYIPVNDYPEINFIGLLIGPRGNTLKQMEAESGAKIAIRGKGSMKDGKGRNDGPHQQNQDEDLHCLITSDSEEKIQKAIERVNKVIETAASVPEGQNDLKRGQLRELAALNGTLRDDENQACQNCGEIGHRKYDCPNRKNFTAAIKCYECGNMGHMARDCKERGRIDNRMDGRSRHSSQHQNGYPGNHRNAADQDYDQLMAELGANGHDNVGGGGGGRAGNSYHQNSHHGHHNRQRMIDTPPNRHASAPWQRPDGNGNNSMWPRQQPQYGNDGYGNGTGANGWPRSGMPSNLPPPPPHVYPSSASSTASHPQQSFNLAPGVGRPPPPPPPPTNTNLTPITQGVASSSTVPAPPLAPPGLAAPPGLPAAPGTSSSMAPPPGRMVAPPAPPGAANRNGAGQRPPPPPHSAPAAPSDAQPDQTRDQ